MLQGWDKLTPEDEDRILRGVVEKRVFGGPWALEIQPTNLCNVACFFCSSEFNRHGEFLDWDALEGLIRAAASRDLKSIRLSGGGESLVHPNTRQTLDLCQELGVTLSDVTTNGSTLSAHAQAIAATGADTISISVNEPNATLYAETMKCGERLFGRVVEGAKAMRAAIDALPPGQPRPEIHLKFMVWKRNCRLIADIYRLALDIGADKIEFNNIVGLDPSLLMGAEDIEFAKGALREVFADAASRGNLEMGFWLNQEGDLQDFAASEWAKARPAPEPEHPEALSSTGSRAEYCLMGWFSATVAATGVVYPCCNFVGLPDKEMGNIHEKPLAEIWEDEPYERFRQEFRRLILLRGRMEHSRRFHRYLEPMCVAQRECPWAWCLAAPSFYSRLADAIEQAAPLERLAARGSEFAIKSARRAKAALARR